VISGIKTVYGYLRIDVADLDKMGVSSVDEIIREFQVHGGKLESRDFVKISLNNDRIMI